MSQESSWNRRDTLTALALVAASFALRALFLFGANDAAWPHSTLYEGDALVWLEWARALRAGQPFEFDLPVRAPGLAFLLSWSGGELAAPFTGLKLLFCGLSAATVGFFFAGLRARASFAVATIASTLLALSFAQYELATSLNNEAPYLALATGALALHVWTGPKRGWGSAVALGALHGLANLLRTEHVGFVAILLVFELFRSRRELGVAVPRALASLAALVLVSLPWTLRAHEAVVRFNEVEPRPIPFVGTRPAWSPDAQVALRELPAFAREGMFLMVTDRVGRAGRSSVERADLERVLDTEFGYRPEPLAAWTLGSTKAKLDLALSNDLTCGGGFSRAALSDKFDRDPPFAFGRPSHLKLYNRGDEVALATLREHPSEWFTLAAAKLARFESGLALGVGATNLPHGLGLRRAAVDIAAPAQRSLLWSVTVLGLGALGLVLALRRGIAAEWGLWLAFKLLVTVAFYGYARQGATAQPALYLGLACALEFALARAGNLERWLWRALLAAAVLVALADLGPWSRPRDLFATPSPGVRFGPVPQAAEGAFGCSGDITLAPRPPK
jgi:hypothetical protein